MSCDEHFTESLHAISHPVARPRSPSLSDTCPHTHATLPPPHPHASLTPTAFRHPHRRYRPPRTITLGSTPLKARRPSEASSKLGSEAESSTDLRGPTASSLVVPQRSFSPQMIRWSKSECGSFGAKRKVLIWDLKMATPGKVHSCGSR